MKIAITARDEDLDSMIDQRFGRAEKFIIYETENGKYQVIDNEQNLKAAQGAGIQAAQTIVNSGTEILITGHCGPKAFHVLNTAGIKVYTGGGVAREAVKMYLSGKLKQAESADVEGHWI